MRHFALAKINRYVLYSSPLGSSQHPCISATLSSYWVLHDNNLFGTFETLFLLKIRSLENMKSDKALKQI